MTLDKQVVSLELAKKMKELGFHQESLFWWVRQGEHFAMSDKQEAGIAKITNEKPPYDFPYESLGSAYTVAELGEMLPDATSLTRRAVDGSWRYPGITGESKYADTEANARAKMLIYLAENNLINPKDITL